MVDGGGSRERVTLARGGKGQCVGKNTLEVKLTSLKVKLTSLKVK